MDQPPEWWAPWLIERAHVVSKPRILDPRVIVLLCSLCHRSQHGMTLAVSPDSSPDGTVEPLLPPPDLANMLWLKFRFDPFNYDPEIMQRCSIQRLPDPEQPPLIVRKAYAKRRQSYPQATLQDTPAIETSSEPSKPATKR